MFSLNSLRREPRMQSCTCCKNKRAPLSLFKIRADNEDHNNEDPQSMGLAHLSLSGLAMVVARPFFHGSEELRYPRFGFRWLFVSLFESFNVACANYNEATCVPTIGSNMVAFKPKYRSSSLRHNACTSLGHLRCWTSSRVIRTPVTYS